MKRAALAPLALFLVACGGDDSAASNVESPDDGGLVNIAASVEEVLEHGDLIGACETYFAAPGDASRREMLLCGKEMFFYEGFDIPGAPTVIAEFFGRLDSVDDWTAFGMIRDPYGADGLALGLVDGAPLEGESPTVTFGCASCHFGQSADGRYVVGHPNQRYDYGGQTLALTMGPGLAIGIDTPDDHHEAAVARLQPILDELRAKPELQSELLQQLLPLADAAPDGPVISVEQEGFYASWKPGTQDPIMDPVGSDDNVHVALKIPTLFDLPQREEVAAAGGVDSSMIGWTGNVPAMSDMLPLFVLLSDSDSGWTAERLRPLAEYVYSLRAPANPSPPEANAIARGEEVFAELGCDGCHNGPDGSGLRIFSFDEVGTDRSLEGYIDSDMDGVPEPAYLAPYGVTHGVKSPRLRGLWSLDMFLHNGSVTSLEALLCLEGERPTITEAPFSDRGHTFGCDADDADREALIAYLHSL